MFFFFFFVSWLMEKTGRTAETPMTAGPSTRQRIAAVSFLSSELGGHRWGRKLRGDLQRLTPPPGPRSPPALKHAACHSDRESSPERISRNQGNRWPDSPPPPSTVACHQFCPIRVRRPIGERLQTAFVQQLRRRRFLRTNICIQIL